METVDLSTEALWTRGIAGDGEAFGLVFDAFHDRVFRHAYRILQNAHDAEDASGVAFLELWRRRHQVHLVDGSPLPWLLAATTNSCRNLSRAKRRYRALLDALPHGTPSPSAEESALHQLTTDRALAAAIAKLADTDAELFALVALEGYSIVDAAAVLGLSAGAARTRMHRARTALHRELGHDTLVGYLSKEAT
ncbi:MAG: RNA polymerase sigma factor [Microbacterium sp.]|uniref:RNA polymerase sigma factor n=1 Tax=Microbacterium sp. TaxID=51671 RepID=UPI003F7D2E48